MVRQRDREPVEREPPALPRGGLKRAQSAGRSQIGQIKGSTLNCATASGPVAAKRRSHARTRGPRRYNTHPIIIIALYLSHPLRRLSPPLLASRAPNKVVCCLCNVVTCLDCAKRAAVRCSKVTAHRQSSLSSVLSSLDAHRGRSGRASPCLQTQWTARSQLPS